MDIPSRAGRGPAADCRVDIPRVGRRRRRAISGGWSSRVFGRDPSADAPRRHLRGAAATSPPGAATTSARRRRDLSTADASASVATVSARFWTTSPSPRRRAAAPPRRAAHVDGASLFSRRSANLGETKPVFVRFCGVGLLASSSEGPRRRDHPVQVSVRAGTFTRPLAAFARCSKPQDFISTLVDAPEGCHRRVGSPKHDATGERLAAIHICRPTA